MCGFVLYRVLLIFFLFENVSSTGDNKTVCYKTTGCFSLDYPWKSADESYYYPPQNPDEIDIKYFLVTRDKSGFVRREIKHGEEIKPRNWTYVIIHGYYSSASVDWISQMEQALIMKGDNNVISIDWSKGCSTIIYQQAVSNTRVVAAEVARLLNKLIKYNSVSKSKLHLIGHSLGAQLASYVGAAIPKIARITGLDPSLPKFELNENLIRLDPGDANFVEVVHTNAGVFGHADKMGHVDFYVNGGKFQPGCTMAEIKSRVLNGLIMEYLRCSHSRANYLYVEAIKSDCKFWGRPWDFIGVPNESIACTEETCQIMGLRSSSLPGRGVFYLSTNPESPYCKSNTGTNEKREEAPVSVEVTKPQSNVLVATSPPQTTGFWFWTQVLNQLYTKLKNMYSLH